MPTDSQPLVSVVVIAYNSAAFVLDTLESIAAQSYPNLELIISDDASTDRTVPLCREWIAQHRQRFARIVLVTAVDNRGVTTNFRRGINQAAGHYVKTIAADDLLYPDAIERYVEHMVEYPYITYLFGKIDAFGDDADVVADFERNMLQYQFFDLTVDKQYECLMNNACYIPAPSLFYDREWHEILGITPDESIAMMEDWPLWINCTLNGAKLFLLDAVTVRYRLHSAAVSKSKGLSAFARAQLQLFVKYQFRNNMVEHPRTTWIKYVLCRQLLDGGPLWIALEKIGRSVDGLYRAWRHSDINDWDKMRAALPKK